MARKKTICLMEGCGVPVSCRQVCAAHYRQLKKIGQLPERIRGVKLDCSVDGCEWPAIALGLCQAHYARLRRNGDPLGGPGRGSPGKARGARGIMSREERHEKPKVFLQHETDSGLEAKMETIHVMEHKFGRPLLPGEFVSHIDGNTLNNRPENLELWLVELPPVESLEELLKWAQTLNDRYHLVSRNKSV